MKKLIIWTLLAILLMIGCPWLAVTFAGSAGMAICFMLFFAINPLFSAVGGAFAGKDIKQLWILPIITAVLFLTGTWLFFDMGEVAFLLYCCCYLVIGMIAMLISAFVNKRKRALVFREVARKKQALSAEQIAHILRSEKRGVLSVYGENGYPYGLPMNYWYNEENGYIYFHSGKKGHKVDAISSNRKVSFCVYDAGYKNDGDWALNISSVIVFGKMYPVENFEWSMEICRRLSLKYTPDMEYIETEISNFGAATLCYELRPEHITGKTVKES